MLKHSLFFLVLTLCAILLSSLPSHAQTQTHFSIAETDFAKLSVLHEGRIKPLSSFSKIMLKRIAGVETYNQRPAIDWLALVVFDPKTAAQIPTFRVKNAKLRHMLSLDDDRIYFSLLDLSTPIAENFEQYAKLVKTPVKELNPDQLDFLKLYDDVASYNELMRALTLILPLEVKVPAQYKKLKNPTYLDLQRYASEIATNKAKEYQTLNDQISLLRRGGVDNSLFRIIPPQWQDVKDGTWHTPWETVLQGYGSPAASQYLDMWKELALAYRAQNLHLFEKMATQAFVFISSQTPYKDNLVMENLYTQLDPFYWAQIGYGIALFFLILWFTTKHRLFWRPAILATICGLALHKSGILLRIAILERPPISTLHETILFISFVAAAYTFFIEFKKKDGLSLFFTSIIGLGLLLLSVGFIDSGNSKPIIAAVLNSNFWLGTHVIIISLGYGFCLITALYAHYLLAQKEPDKPLIKLVLPLSLFSLFLMCTGTLLGGIWADQSWGRFWGWDPKENGALLVILWLVWIIHGRLSGDISQRIFFAGMAALNIFLALSWFGVNLLGVGLHSYGFIQGASLGLLGFCTAEFLYIIYFLNAHKKIKK